MATAGSLAPLLEQLHTTPAGLSAAEAARRLTESGPNEIAEAKRSPLRELFAEFWGPVPWMIEVAAALSLAVGDWADFGIIATLLLANAAIGFWEESRAGNAIEELRSRLARQARALRDGAWKTLPTRELVPGDVVRVRLGDVVPADLALLSGGSVEVDQSALTGESLPVERAEGEALLSGSIVRRGEVEALVTATGMRTRFGRTASLVERETGPSHYQRAVMRIGNFLIACTLVLVFVILAVALARAEPLLATAQFCLILTVAAIPVAMPAVLSVTMAVGAQKLARMRAIVSRLVSIEELAGMDVLCSDKTGTLTQNRLVPGEPLALGGASSGDVLRAAALASRAEDEDPIDLAVLEGAKRAGASPDGERVASFRPFDPVSKRTEARVLEGGGSFAVTKGAPQAVLALCTPDAGLSDAVARGVETFAERGDRALGVAREDGNGWRFLGLLPLFDPPREDSAATIADLEQLGVAVKMVTGDHVAIAKETARKLGLGSEIHAAGELFHDESTPSDEAIEGADGFAQVFPEHKYGIVEALQRRGHFVGMTGDGVNDAPALKKADAGIAVSGATDAARSAADLVLTAPGLAVIGDAVRESRRIFRRMQSYAIYRIAETVRVLGFMTLAILAFGFYPLTPVMIVILAILNDGPILMIAYDRTDLPERPVRWRMAKVLGIATILGVLGLVASFLLLWLGERVFRLDRPTIQTLMFLKMTVAGHMTIYLARTGEKHFWTRPFPSPRLLIAAESTQIVATLLAVYGLFVPAIGWRLALLVWGYSLAWFLVNGLVKTWAFRTFDQGGRWGARLSARLTRPLHA